MTPLRRTCHGAALTRRQRAGLLGLLGLVTASVSCSAPPTPPVEPTSPSGSAVVPTGRRLRFAFEALDGKPVSDRSLAGRITVLGFVTTYDMASQAQARFLAGLSRRHVPRVNVALLVLEPPDNRPMVEAFASVLRLPYPVALVDAATIAGEGAFSGLHHVPSVVVLDREGRERWRNVGLVDEEAIDAALRAIERDGS